MPPTPKRRPHRDVLEDLLADPAATTAPAAAPPLPPTPPRAATMRRAQRFTINLAPDLIDRLRSAVRNTDDLTLSGLAATALDKEIKRLEKLRGAPFPPFRGHLPIGRPVR